MLVFARQSACAQFSQTEHLPQPLLSTTHKPPAIGQFTASHLLIASVVHLSHVPQYHAANLVELQVARSDDGGFHDGHGMVEQVVEESVAAPPSMLEQLEPPYWGMGLVQSRRLVRVPVCPHAVTLHASNPPQSDQPPLYIL